MENAIGLNFGEVVMKTGISRGVNGLEERVVRQFGRMCIRMVRFCRFADVLRMLG